MTGTLLGCIESAQSVVEELRDEITEWQENMESNNMEHMPKYDEVTECKDALDNMLDGELDSIDCPEFLQDLEVRYTQDTRASATSRAARLGNAENEFSAARARVEEWLEDNEALEENDDEDAGEIVTEDDVREREEQRDAAQEFLSTLENIEGMFSDVSFPGMY